MILSIEKPLVSEACDAAFCVPHELGCLSLALRMNNSLRSGPPNRAAGTHNVRVPLVHQRVFPESSEVFEPRKNPSQAPFRWPPGPNNCAKYIWDSPDASPELDRRHCFVPAATVRDSRAPTRRKRDDRETGPARAHPMMDRIESDRKVAEKR